MTGNGGTPFMKLHGSNGKAFRNLLAQTISCPWMLTATRGLLYFFLSNVSSSTFRMQSTSCFYLNEAVVACLCAGMLQFFRVLILGCSYLLAWRTHCFMNIIYTENQMSTNCQKCNRRWFRCNINTTSKADAAIGMHHFRSKWFGSGITADVSNSKQ